MIFDSILVTTDLSEDAKVAYDIAAYQAKTARGHITLISVFEEFELPVVLQKQVSDPASFAKMREEYEDQMKRSLEEVAKTQFHGMDVSCVPIFSNQSPGNVISEWAKENGINLIVMASHGKGAVGNFFLGSTAQRIIKNAECPVMVIPKLG